MLRLFITANDIHWGKKYGCSVLSNQVARKYNKKTNPETDGKGTKEKVRKMRQFLYKDTNRDADDHIENVNSGKGTTTADVRKRQHGLNGWDELWRAKLTPWDLGQPTPALQSELRKYGHEQIEFQEHTRVKGKASLRSLIPGCGAGYDLVTLANHHERSLAQVTATTASVDSLVVGLDVSTKSLSHAKQSVSSLLEENGDFSEKQVTSIMLCEGDFFDETNTWENIDSIDCGIANNNGNGLPTQTDSSIGKTFDFIFDYTFFCALPPDLRHQWASRMSTLLEPRSGRLLTLIFPILPDEDESKTHEPEGPPYPVTVEEYKRVLEPFGFRIVPGMGPYESTDTVKERVSKELVCWWELVP